MMNRKIIIFLIVVWSVVILGIGSQPPDDDSKSTGSQPADDDLEKKQIILEYFDQESHILDKVVLYYKKINESSSSNNKKKKGKLSDSEEFVLAQATFFTFWIAVTLRIYSEFNSCLIDKEHETKFLDYYLKEITFVFNEFRKEIKEYRQVEKKKKKKHKSAVIDVNSYENFKFEEAIDMTLNLSLDFVSSESTLMEKEPDKYENGIIVWELIENYNVEKKIYKTIFPSCLYIRRTFHETCLKKQNNRISHFHSYMPIKFYKAEPVEFYSNANNWKNVNKDITIIYTHWYNFRSMDQVRFSLLTELVDRVIDLEKLHNIQDFFTEVTLGNEKAQLVKETLHDRSRILSTFEDTSKIILKLENITKIRDTVQKKNSKNENTEMSTQERIENVIELVKSIREVDKMTLSLKWTQRNS